MKQVENDPIIDLFYKYLFHSAFYTFFKTCTTLETTKLLYVNLFPLRILSVGFKNFAKRLIIGIT